MTRRASIVIGTRGSPLALIQAGMVRDALIAARPSLAAEGAIEIRVIRTTGDRVQDRPLSEIGGKGLFTREIDSAQQAGEIDLAAHSMKDVPTILADGLIIDAVLPRADPRDVLIASVPSIAELPIGAVVGTSSLRRRAQLLAMRPDLRIVDLRGNVQTRLARVAGGELAATLLAAAGLDRLGLAIGSPIPVQEMLPAPAQGAIGIARRADDEQMRSLLDLLVDPKTLAAITAERALLRVLDGSCRTPIAALATLDGSQLVLDGLATNPDGSNLRRIRRRGPASEPATLGENAGRLLRDANNVG